MRISWTLLGAISLVSTVALADPAVIIRERAKELRDQNNVRQGVESPVQAAQPAPTPMAPAGPVMSPSLVRFSTTIATIRSDAAVSPEQKQKLTLDLMQAAQGARPSQASVAKLAADVSAAFAEKPLPASSRARFVQELDAMFNPGKYPQAKPDRILSDIQAIFQENGLARMKAAAISQDVEKIHNEIQKGGG